MRNFFGNLFLDKQKLYLILNCICYLFALGFFISSIPAIGWLFVGLQWVWVFLAFLNRNKN